MHLTEANARGLLFLSMIYNCSREELKYGNRIYFLAR
jgi:hypothetical protein